MPKKTKTKTPSCKKLLRVRKVTKMRNWYCDLFKKKDQTKCKKSFNKGFMDSCNKKTRKNKK